MIRDVGDLFGLEHLVYNDAGVLTDASVTLAVTAPDGTASNPTVTHVDTGTYTANIDLTSAGVWQWVWTVSGTVQDVANGQVTAADPAPATYASLARLKSALGMDAADTTRDDYLLLVLDAASRSVEEYCDGRVFYLAASPTARTFPLGRRLVNDSMFGWCAQRFPVDDIGALDGLLVEVSTDGLTWTTITDAQVWPANALAKGKPITYVASPTVNLWCYNQARVTARWGWPSTPGQVENATLLTATRYARRPSSPEGVAGSADWGLIRIPYMDPDVQAQLAFLRDIKVG